jgi:phosphatidylglycerol:prolipoprotein diacylglycerol transferase
MQKISTISFPGLGIENFTVNSVAFEIFGLSIAWYALIITMGMVAAVVYVVLQAKKIGITLDDVIDYALFTIPIGIVGARLYYVFTKLEEFDNFFDVINIRGGGLAIYGGIIAGGITVLCVSYYKKINFLAFADCVAPGVLLAQGIGRWGNFMNGEAYGGPWDGFLRMGLFNANTMSDKELIKAGVDVSEMVYVHPTFLYESLWNILGVLLVYLFARLIHKKYDGQLFLMIFGWYGLGRMLIEGLRTDSLYFGPEEWGIRISQALAAMIFVAAAALLIYFQIKKPNKPFYHKESVVNNKNVKKGNK